MYMCITGFYLSDIRLAEYDVRIFDQYRYKIRPLVVLNLGKCHGLYSLRLARAAHFCTHPVCTDGYHVTNGSDYEELVQHAYMYNIGQQ